MAGITVVCNSRDHEENYNSQCNRAKSAISFPSQGEHHWGMFCPKYLYAWISVHMKGKESDGEKKRPIQENYTAEVTCEDRMIMLYI